MQSIIKRSKDQSETGKTLKN